MTEITFRKSRRLSLLRLFIKKEFPFYSTILIGSRPLHLEPGTLGQAA
jgi:hypothetical protein